MSWNFPESPRNIKGPTLGGKYIWSDLYLLAGWRIQKNFLSGHFRLLDDQDNRQAWGSYDHCRDRLEDFRSERGLQFSSRHIILLLHGLGRHKNTMAKTAGFLRERGHQAFCLNYPSTLQSLTSHADDLVHLLSNLDGVTSVDFIGHSLGGLVAREVLNRKNWRARIDARHLVMLGTPNNGARIADMINGLKLYQAIAGPSGQDVRPYKAQALPPPDVPTLVIAGGRGVKAGFNPLLGEDNDGIVTVNETKIDGMAAFKRVKVIHTTIMDHPDSLQAIAAFIER